MSNGTEWYIVKAEDGHCQIVTATEKENSQSAEVWGPFASQAEAIAKRVGLIRAGKCQPN